MKIVVPGGSGQVGAVLVRALCANGHEAVILSRGGAGGARVVQWDARTVGPWAREIDGADVVINLAGRNVNCRYTEENLNEMMSSRIDSTRAVGLAIEKATHPPRVWLQMSTATIYAHRFDAPNDEATGRIGGEEPDAPQLWGGQHRDREGVGSRPRRGEHAVDAEGGSAERDGDGAGSGRHIRHPPPPNAL